MNDQASENAIFITCRFEYFLLTGCGLRSIQYWQAKRIFCPLCSCCCCAAISAISVRRVRSTVKDCGSSLLTPPPPPPTSHWQWKRCWPASVRLLCGYNLQTCIRSCNADSPVVVVVVVLLLLVLLLLMMMVVVVAAVLQLGERERKFIPVGSRSYRRPSSRPAVETSQHRRVLAKPKHSNLQREDIAAAAAAMKVASVSWRTDAAFELCLANMLNAMSGQFAVRGKQREKETYSILAIFLSQSYLCNVHWTTPLSSTTFLLLLHFLLFSNTFLVCLAVCIIYTCTEKYSIALLYW